MVSSLVGKGPVNFFKGQFYIFLKSLKTFYNEANEEIGTEGIEADDIRQGQLGDCYFLSSISAVAEYPSRIKKIFISQKINDYGIYCIKLCHFGEWQAVYVDDFFPCNSNGPAFTKGNENEIWVSIFFF